MGFRRLHVDGPRNVFGYIAFHDPAHAILDNRVFELMSAHLRCDDQRRAHIHPVIFVLMGT